MLAVMPTGSGKSLCYQLPAIVRPGLTLVVSPLIALMRDQVRALSAAGVVAGSLNSSNEPAENARVLDLVRRRELRLLYVAPERLARPDTVEMWPRPMSAEAPTMRTASRNGAGLPPTIPLGSRAPDAADCRPLRSPPPPNADRGDTSTSFLRPAGTRAHLRPPNLRSPSNPRASSLQV